MLRLATITGHPERGGFFSFLPLLVFFTQQLFLVSFSALQSVSYPLQVISITFVSFLCTQTFKVRTINLSNLVVNFLDMGSSDKKNEIIQTLQATNDEQLIDEVYELLHREKTIVNISIKDLPNELQDKITRGLDDYRNGRFISHAQMKEKVEKWLTN